MHKFLLYNKFIICLYMFRVLCVHHQEVKIVLYSVWYLHTCRWPSCAPDGHLQTRICVIWRIKDQLDVTCYFISILMCSTCFGHKNWNKIASDIKLVFYSSTITTMHGPITIRISALIWLITKIKTVEKGFSPFIFLSVYPKLSDDGWSGQSKHVVMYEKDYFSRSICCVWSASWHVVEKYTEGRRHQKLLLLFYFESPCLSCDGDWCRSDIKEESLVNEKGWHAPNF